jgi:hypothetical protein
MLLSRHTRRRGFRFWRKADTAFAFSRLFRVQLSRFGEAAFSSISRLAHAFVLLRRERADRLANVQAATAGMNSGNR